MKFKFIKTHQPEYLRALMLRWEVLQKPLGMPPGSELCPEEDKGLHLIAVEGKQVVGCVLFYQKEKDKGQLQQFAISQEYKGSGFARKLLHFLEQALFKKGIHQISLFASEDVVNFYAHMGYDCDGDKQVEYGVTHYLMVKRL